MAAGSISGSSPWMLTMMVGVVGCRHFGHAVGAGEMIGARHADPGAEPSRGRRDALVVGGDEDFAEVARLTSPLPDVLDHGFAG